MPELPLQFSIGLTIREAAGKRHPGFPRSKTGHTCRRAGNMQASVREKDSSPVNSRGQKDVGLFR